MVRNIKIKRMDIDTGTQFYFLKLFAGSILAKKGINYQIFNKNIFSITYSGPFGMFLANLVQIN